MVNVKIGSVETLCNVCGEFSLRDSFFRHEVQSVLVQFHYSCVEHSFNSWKLFHFHAVLGCRDDVD